MADLEFIKCPKCGLSFQWTDYSPQHPQGRKITTQCFNCGATFTPQRGIKLGAQAEAPTAAEGSQQTGWWGKVKALFSGRR